MKFLDKLLCQSRFSVINQIPIYTLLCYSILNYRQNIKLLPPAVLFYFCRFRHFFKSIDICIIFFHLKKFFFLQLFLNRLINRFNHSAFQSLEINSSLYGTAGCTFHTLLNRFSYMCFFIMQLINYVFRTSAFAFNRNHAFFTHIFQQLCCL